MRLLTTLLMTLLVTACQTGESDDASPVSEVVGSEERLHVGVVTDEDLRKVLYKALDAQLSKKQALGEDGEQTTEIGDLESFKFTITRLGKGKDEATGSDVPDNADVDVTGWYKVSLSGGQRDAEPACTSFDASMTIAKIAGEWQATPGKEATIGREDSEDCF